MDRDLGTVLFGLVSAASWGSGDFSGGRAARRTSVLVVLLISEAVGSVLLLAAALALGERLPDAAALMWAAAAGIGGTVGLAALYRGLATGAAAVVAPVSALVSAAIPVAVGAALEGAPAPTVLAGFALALAGIWLVAGGGGWQTMRALGLPLLAGIGFGAFFVCIHRASAEATFWPLFVARLVALLLGLPLALARRSWRGVSIGSAWLPALAGIFDAGGNLFFVLAGQLGRLDTASVLSSLYPATTVLLARLIDGEPIGRRQWLGLATVLAAIALIAA